VKKLFSHRKLPSEQKPVREEVAERTGNPFSQANKSQKKLEK
jgi:hypothetical protein